MNPHDHITHSAEETMALGRKLAPTLKDARMVILRGDLGTGKTTLVKGIAEGLQAASQDDVTSPLSLSFTNTAAPRSTSTTSICTASTPRASWTR